MYNVMIIDSDPESVRKIKAALNSREFKAWVARSGEEGLKKLEERLPDLLILDIELSDMDGRHVLKKLGDNDKFTGLPVIVASFKSGEDICAEVLELGAGDFLPKPFNSRELAARVRSQLKYVNKRADVTESVGDAYKIGRNVIVRFDENEVNIANEVIMLSKQEIDIFAGLVRNNGHLSVRENELPESVRTILGREEIYSHISALSTNGDNRKATV